LTAWNAAVTKRRASSTVGSSGQLIIFMVLEIQRQRALLCTLSKKKEDPQLSVSLLPSLEG
jgi:hypothetical protein